jgi:Electron transfer flavoprotein, beta subunit
MLAELLNIPSISTVVKLEIENGKVRAEREVEGGVEIVESSLPIVITAQKGLNEPRYASLKGIMAAKSKPIEEKNFETSMNRLIVNELKLPESKRKSKIVGTDASAVAELVRLLREEAKVI